MGRAGLEPANGGLKARCVGPDFATGPDRFVRPVALAYWGSSHEVGVSGILF